MHPALMILAVTEIAEVKTCSAHGVSFRSPSVLDAVVSRSRSTEMTGSEHSAEIAAIVAALAPTAAEPVTGLATAASKRAEGVLGSSAVAWAAQLAGEVAAGMQARHPDHAAPADDIAVQGEILILRMLFTLAGVDQGDDETDLAAKTQESIRQLVAMGVPFDLVAESLRLANELVIRALLDVAIAHQASAATLTMISLTVTHSINEMLDTMANQYLTERQRFSSSGINAQQEMIDMLIAGRPVDPRLVKSVLKTSIGDYHLGFVVSGTASLPLDLPTLRHAVEVVRNHVHASGFVVRENADSVWVWATSARPALLDEADPGVAIGEAVRVGVGSTQPDAAGFRRTHLEAAAANHFGRFRSARLIEYSQHALPILLGIDQERTKWFLESELGELTTSSPRNRDLLKTLRCYYDSRLRVAVAAERLHVHRNTAISRLATLETILGHPLAERMAEIQAALSILDFEDDGHAR